jgi:hypothetical protein
MGFSNGNVSISGSSDVVLNNPTNQQALTYDTSISKWKNASLSSIDVTAVHLTGAEAVTGVKSFSVSPTVPTPSGSSDVANKSYVDSKVVNYAQLAAGSVVVVDYVTASSTYPSRPSSRTDIVIRWRGPVAPSVGGNGAVDNVDEWLNTAP